MRAKTLGALLALLLVPAVASATPGVEAATAAECCAAYCAPIADKPYAHMIGGEPYVSALVRVECAVEVDSITVHGAIQLDGATAESATKTCKGTYVCKMLLSRRNPPGQQTWRGVANGHYVRWGQRHNLWVEYSPTLRA